MLPACRATYAVIFGLEDRQASRDRRREHRQRADHENDRDSALPPQAHRLNTEPADGVKGAISLRLEEHDFLLEPRVLTAAVECHEDCMRTPDPLKGRCREVVQVMRQVNREAQDIRVLGELALASNDDDLLTEAADHLETLRDRLRQQVLDQMARDDQIAKRRE